MAVKKQFLKKKQNPKRNREVCQIAQNGLKVSGIRPGRTLTPDKCLQLSVNHGGGLVTAWGYILTSGIWDPAKTDEMMNTEKYNLTLIHYALSSGKDLIGSNFIFST